MAMDTSSPSLIVNLSTVAGYVDLDAMESLIAAARHVREANKRHSASDSGGHLTVAFVALMEAIKALAVQ